MTMHPPLPDAPVLVKTPASPDWHTVDWNHYPNAEPLLPVEKLPHMLPHVVCVRPIDIESFVVPMFMIDALLARGGKAPLLLLPCVPGSRQDRMNPTGDVLFTLKSVADMVNQRKLPRVLVVDPHSDVTAALINNVKVVRAADVVTIFRDKFPTYTGVIAPDAGASKRALEVAQVLGVPMFQAWKKRDVATGKLSGFGCEPLPPGRLLVVDDLCDGGGTFNGLAAHVSTITEADLDLYVTHGLFTRGVDELKSRYHTIYTTDSTLAGYPNECTILPICARLT